LESELGRGSTFSVIIPWVHPGQMRSDMGAPDGLSNRSRSEFAHAPAEAEALGSTG
jgi:hypothetical protein